jgi:LDH2 family malate/lactate/ureidoglycolate dehydrogenase
MTVLVKHEPLRRFVSDVYERAGVPAVDAVLLSDSLVQADLWGHQSHGVLRTGWYLARLQSGVMKAVTEPKFVVDAGAVAVVDGRDGVGQVVSRFAAEDAIRRAKAHGVSAVAVRNSNHFGTCMYYTRMAAETAAS